MTRRASHRGRAVPGPLAGAAALAVTAVLATAFALATAGVPGGRAADPVSARPTAVPAVAAASAREVPAPSPPGVAQVGTTHPVPRSTVPPGAAGGARRAAEVLHAWDAARARAYASGDPAALRRLYVAGSRAGASDVRVLRAYARRGLRVEGMRMQVLALDVLRDEPRLLRVRVTDRLVGAVAVPESGAGDRIALPRDAASSRVVALRRVAGRWRVAGVRE